MRVCVHKPITFTAAAASSSRRQNSKALPTTHLLPPSSFNVPVHIPVHIPSLKPPCPPHPHKGLFLFQALKRSSFLVSITTVATLPSPSPPSSPFNALSPPCHLLPWPRAKHSPPHGRLPLLQLKVPPIQLPANGTRLVRPRRTSQRTSRSSKSLNTPSRTSSQPSQSTASSDRHSSSPRTSCVTLSLSPHSVTLLAGSTPPSLASTSSLRH